MTIELPNGRKIGPGHPAFIVAEIGQNHQGDVYTALRLIKAAVDAGCDAVKLCKRHIPSELTTAAYNAPYPGPQSFGPTYGKHREALELSIEDYVHLQDRIRYNEWPIILFATVCDIHSADEVEEHLDPPLYKIASRDLDNLPLIEHVAKFGKPMILSTGMARESDIDEAIEVAWSHNAQTIRMICTSEYPTPDDHVRLSPSPFMGEIAGFSDHTVGIVASQLAVSLGARVIEKHLTLARAMPGTDHAGSLEPYGMFKMVRNIRAVEAMMRPDDFRPDVSAARTKLGRSLVSRRRILPGETITEDMLCLKSPGDGIRWGHRSIVVGSTARVLIQADVTIQRCDVFQPEEVKSC